MKVCLVIFGVLLSSTVFAGKIGGRVVGGEDAIPHSAKFIVSIALDELPERHFCGGAIINPYWVLTAAHCVFSPEETILIAGQHDQEVLEPWEQRRHIAKYFNHEDYCGGACPFDFALLKVDKPFTFDEYVQPIDLPAFRSIPTGTATIFGWGSISNTTEFVFPTILQKLNKPILDYSTCRQVWSDQDYDPSNLCTGPLDGSGSSCSADSGGPLIQEVDGRQTLIGVLGWGAFPCATPNTASVYTRVSAMIGWIDNIQNNN